MRPSSSAKRVAGTPKALTFERKNALQQLAKHDAVRQGEARAVELLTGLLDDSDVSVRREAINALGAAPGPAVTELLVRYLEP